MPRLPENPNIDLVEEQAIELLFLYESNDAGAFERFRKSLPAAEGKDDAAIAALRLGLEDAQLCIAREYNLPEWKNLKNYIDWRSSRFSNAREDAVPLWLHNVYGHETDPPRPKLAAQMLRERPDLGEGDLFLACAVGDESAVRQAIAADPDCVDKIGSEWRCPGCKRPLGMPPLVAVTHSTLIQLPEYRDRLRRCARLLLEAGADPNQSWTDGEHTITALFGAAGKNHDPELTRMLLEAGASPNDGQSLYGAVEAHDSSCARLLLEAGAIVEGSNALHHQLDSENLGGLRLLLAHTKDVNDSSSSLGSPLLWAIRRRRSLDHVDALLQAGADPRAKNKEGVSAFRLACFYGLTDAAEALGQAGAQADLSIEDQFVAACARADRSEAQRIQTTRPDIVNALSEVHLRQFPNLAEAKRHDAVRLMIELGWPIAVRGGDWDATALNIAVFQGDAGLTRYLLEHGASWREEHGFGDNVNGTLSWASRNHDPDEGDWVGCARALVEHGMPILEIDGDYSDEVGQFLASERARLQGN